MESDELSRPDAPGGEQPDQSPTPPRPAPGKRTPLNFGILDKDDPERAYAQLRAMIDRVKAEAEAEAEE